MTLTSQQNQVLDHIKLFMESNAQVFILKGYAGTGKTTMVKQIADYIHELRKVYLMAPTGRAAQILREKTGYEATTIHHAIYEIEAPPTKEIKDFAASDLKICFHTRQQTEKSVVIIDEASMLLSRTSQHEIYKFGTNNLMDDLLTFARPSFGGKLIFVGDPAQLPPVGESESQALNPKFFEDKNLKVMTAELTEVLRQTGDSVILNNAMAIRDLLQQEKRNRLVFEEKPKDVEHLKTEDILPQYMEKRRSGKEEDQVIICFSNRAATLYNKEIRQQLYREPAPELKVGDILMVVQNNYLLNRMNGEFIKVLRVGHREQITAPVYVQQGADKIRKEFTLEFIHIDIENEFNEATDCLLLLDLLNNDQATISIDEQKALYISFCIRHQELKQGTQSFAQTLKEDPYYNCLRAKYGYAVTGHKCQGGEWNYVFVDYTGRTGLSNDCLRWAYTATTRAQKNTLHIEPTAHYAILTISD